MATATACPHCKTTPDVRRVAIPGSVPVDLGLCDCDYLTCPAKGCGRRLRNLPNGSHKCPHCKAIL